MEFRPGMERRNGEWRPTPALVFAAPVLLEQLHALAMQAELHGIDTRGARYAIRLALATPETREPPKAPRSA